MPSIPPPAVSLLEPGYRLERYELLCKIGQGGMASVWLARTKSSAGADVFVAVKTLLPEHASNDALRKMMLDEARIAMAIDHPNVATTLESGELFDIPYLVLEYVPGESVEQLCDALATSGRTVPAPIVARIVVDACAGIHAAHELVGPDGAHLGVVHRDVSPHNMLVDEEGILRLIDFGVATANERVSPTTASGALKGKLAWMAPEHALGEAVDRRADVWSLGAVAYVLLAGKLPYDGPNDAARLIRKLGAEPPNALPSSVRPALAEAVMRALAPKREDRFATAAQLATAIAAAVPPATHDEVAAFFRENLRPAIKARGLIVEKALAAAAGRARAREIIDGPRSGATPSPPVAAPADDRGASVVDRSSNETIAGVASGAPSAFRAPRPWSNYVGAGIVALLVVLSFAAGAMTGRRDPPDRDRPAAATGDRPISAVPTTAAEAPPRASASASATARATATATMKPATSAVRPSPRPSASAAPSASASAEGPAAASSASRDDGVF